MTAAVAARLHGTPGRGASSVDLGVGGAASSPASGARAARGATVGPHLHDPVRGRPRPRPR